MGRGRVMGAAALLASGLAVACGVLVGIDDEPGVKYVKPPHATCPRAHRPPPPCDGGCTGGGGPFE